MVKVLFYSHLRRVLGTRQAEVQAGTVRELIEALAARFGDDFTSRMPHCKVYVNGRHVGLGKGRGTRIDAGDEVVILPPVAGG